MLTHTQTHKQSTVPSAHAGEGNYFVFIVTHISVVLRRIVALPQHSYVSIVYRTIESHYIITNVMYSMHVKIISPRQRLGLRHFPHHFCHVSTNFMINNLVIIKLTYKLYISCMVHCSSTRLMYAPAIVCNISDRLRSARVNIMIQ